MDLVELDQIVNGFKIHCGRRSNVSCRQAAVAKLEEANVIHLTLVHDSDGAVKVGAHFKARPENEEAVDRCSEKK